MTASLEIREWYCPGCDRSYPEAGVCAVDGTRLIPLAEGRDPMLGRSIDGRFVIRDRLGHGGMGVVYRGWQSSVGREVAIKVIRPRPGHDAATAKRFLREAKLASSLSQPSTVSVIDFGQTEDGILYLVMELLRGRTLADVLRADGRLGVERAARIAVQVCDALEAAHRVGIVHRDLKPANVMILDDPPGRDLVKVLDFGLAKVIDADESTVTQSGRMVGTPSHLSPEVALGEAATPRSDLYAVGVLLFEMLDGRLPFLADNVNLMVTLHAYQPAPALGPHVPAAVARVVARALAKRPEQRPRSAGELRGLLELAVRGGDLEPSPAEVTGDPPAPPAPPRAAARPAADHDRSEAALAATFPKPKTRPPVGAPAPSAPPASPTAASPVSPGALAAGVVTVATVDLAPRPAAAPSPAAVPAISAAATTAASTTAASTTDRGLVPPNRPARRILVGGGLAIGAVGLALALVRPWSTGAPAATAPIDAATVDASPPLDAATVDAAPVDAAPVDAAPAVPLLDARRRDGDRPPPRLDARRADPGAAVDAAPPPPRPIDAAPPPPRPVDAAPPPPRPVDARVPHPWEP
jgi:serine/threonine protein kinase